MGQLFLLKCPRPSSVSVTKTVLFHVSGALNSPISDFRKTYQFVMLMTSSLTLLTMDLNARLNGIHPLLLLCYVECQSTVEQNFD